MYSILIKMSDKRYSYHLNEDGTVFAGDSTATKAKLQELAHTYPLGSLVVVHNVTLTTDFTIEDVD